MITSNPFNELSATISPGVMKAYVVLMFLAVVVGVILDMKHKKSAKYFFENAKKAAKNAKRTVSEGEKTSLLIQTITSEVLTSSEFCNPDRRKSHLLTMYGFIFFVISSAVMILGYSAPGTSTPAIWPLLWHLGALSLCVGGYWFWFKIRVDVSAEGLPWNRVERADLFILSLLATATFALLWSISGSMLIFALFILSTTVLFGGVYWSKFAHMFFKPAAAHQKKITRADGSRENLPAEYDPADPEVHKRYPDIPMYMGEKPPNMGLSIKAEKPRHY